MIYIHGLAHGGSTLFAKRMGIKKSIAVGETYKFFLNLPVKSEGTKETCSCGKLMRECSFWGPYFKEAIHLSLPEKYAWMITHARSKGYEVIIDSSKRLGALSQYERLQVNLKVWCLVKSPFRWAKSMKQVVQRENKKAHSLFFYTFLGSYLIIRKIFEVRKKNLISFGWERF